MFAAALKPGMNRFDCRLKVLAKKPEPALKAKDGKIIFKTKELKVEINTRTGLIDRYCVKGKNFVNKNAFMPIVVADNADPSGRAIKGVHKDSY